MDYRIHRAQQRPNSSIADTQAMLKLMIDTWEPILERWRISGGRADEAMPTWAAFRQEYAQELPEPSPAQHFVLATKR